MDRFSARVRDTKDSRSFPFRLIIREKSLQYKTNMLTAFYNWESSNFMDMQLLFLLLFEDY